jgi:hypothetical protein
MRGLILLESLLLCLLVLGGFFLVTGTGGPLQLMHRVLGSIIHFLTHTGVVFLGSPRALFSLLVLVLPGVLILSRLATARTVR